MKTEFVDPDTGEVIKSPVIGSHSSAKEIEQMKSFAYEYGIYRLGYPVETAKRVAQEVEEALKRHLQAAA